LVDGDEYLRRGDPAKAVEVLERHLSRIDGNRRYLMLLRDAYRAHVTQLFLKKDEPQARKYLERLRILDPDGATRLEVSRPSAEVQTAAVPALPPPGAPPQAQTTPLPAAASPPPGVTLTAATTQPAIKARGTPAEETSLDPFSRAYEMGRTDGADGLRAKQARDLLVRAEAEFGKQNYAQARRLFEQANQADRGALDGKRDFWAYCRLHAVVEELKQKNAALSDLENEVRTTLAMTSKPELTKFGQGLLSDIGQRRQAAEREEGAANVAVKHYAANGWQVAESDYFRVFHNQPRELAEKVAQVAEQTRSAMSRKWLAGGGEAWPTKCDVYLHTTGADYSRATGVPAASPGHSRIENDKTTGRVASRRMDLRCDNPTMLDAVLPHEATHVVLAGQFGNRDVPRWVDEGIAVLSEPADKVNMHRQNLAKSQRQGELFAVRELMELQDYPHPRRIGAFYAQSVSLVDYLTQQKGPQAFSQFVRDGLRDGYEASLKQHYGFRDFQDLETRWTATALAAAGGADTTAVAER
jgi:hypothetical protein